MHHADAQLPCPRRAPLQRRLGALMGRSPSADDGSYNLRPVLPEAPPLQEIKWLGWADTLSQRWGALAPPPLLQTAGLP